MVFNHKNWTFRRLMNADNSGVKLFHKLAKSVENRFISRESASEIPIEMSDLDISTDSFSSNSKMGSIIFDETEKPVKEYYKSLISLQELRSESSTYLSLENVNEVCESLENVVEEDQFEENREKTLEQPSFLDDTAENEFEDVKDYQSLTCVEASEKSGTNENLENDCEQNVLEQKKVMDCENINGFEVEDDSTDSLKSPDMPNELNILQANMKNMEINKIEDDYNISFEKKNNVTAAVVIKIQAQVQSPEENLDVRRQENNIETDPVNSSAFNGEANGNSLEVNLNDIEGCVTIENDIEDSCKQDTTIEDDLNVALAINHLQLQRPKYLEINSCIVDQQQICVEETLENSRKCIDMPEESNTSQSHLEVIDNIKDNSKIKIKERKSLVKDMITLFNEILCKKSSKPTHCHDALDEITGYPWNLVRQRINQFSKERNENNEGYTKSNQEHISQSLVQQRIQQLLTDTNMDKILNFHSSKSATTQVRNLQMTGENNTKKPIETERTLEIQPESDFYYSNSRTFLRNLQFLLDLHRIDESDNDSQSSHIPSDSLESPTYHEIGNSHKLLRRSFGVENLSNFENYENFNLDCQNSEGCESEFTSTSDDGEEKIYLQFAGYTSDQRSSSNTTTNYHQTIQESETELTEDYLTPVDIPTNMLTNSAAQRNQEISKKFVVNLYESGQMRSLDTCITLKKPADYKLIHSENELHIKNTEIIGDNKHVNYGKLNKHSFENDNRISRRVDSVNVGGNNCISVEVPTQFCQEDNILLRGSETESDRDVIQANGDVEMEENIYASIESENGEKTSKTNDEIYFTLKHETDVQGIIMQQASKALDICRNNKIFFAGKELIEAERILLVATRKYELLRNEIQKAKYDSFKPRNDHALGNITIDNLFLPLQLNEVDFIRYNYYFILILSHGDTIFSTKVVEGNSMNYANFEDTFTFKDLPSNFIITVDIYGLKIKKLADNNRLSKKFKTKNKLENLYSKKKLFYKDVQTITLMETSVAQSSFALCGSVAVTLDDINNSSNTWTIKNACHNIVTNTMNLNVSVSDVRIKCNKKGFLTVGSEVNEHLAWSRRWCVLDGAILKFFNYPTDEDLINPVLTLNFKNSFSGEIEICDRERCAKSRTMLLKTRLMVNGASEFIGHFLSADSRKDLLEWQSKINLIVGALVKWNQLSFDS